MEIMQHVCNIQCVYLLNKYLKCSVWRLVLRYDIYIYIYIYMSLGFKRLNRFNIIIGIGVVNIFSSS